MGYSTDFEGSFTLDKPLKEEHAKYLRAFNESRRMQRDANMAEKLPDPERLAAGLPIGAEGGYYVYNDYDSEEVLDYNEPPQGQPGLWCNWTVGEDGQSIEWDGNEKFYEYVEWLTYLVEHFLAPWGYVLNGEAEWQGEDSDDFGKIVVVNNEVTRKHGRKVYG